VSTAFAIFAVLTVGVCLSGIFFVEAFREDHGSPPGPWTTALVLVALMALFWLAVFVASGA